VGKILGDEHQAIGIPDMARDAATPRRTAEKIAVLAPIARASVNTATMLKPGWRRLWFEGFAGAAGA